MRLTRRKAIEIAIELWEWCAETGKDKRDWPDWEKYGEMYAGCPLCQYSRQERVEGESDCGRCPWWEKFGDCISDDMPLTIYEHWENAATPKTRRKWASKFLAQLKEL